MSKLKVLGKLNPVQFKQMLDHLTKKKIKNPFIKADDIIVNKKPEVEEREIINAFMKRNPRKDLSVGGFVFKGIRNLYKGKKGLQVGRIEKELVRKYKDEGMDFIDAITKANDEAYAIVDSRKLDIVKDALQKTDIRSNDYIKLIDEEFRLEDPESYTFIKNMVERGRDDLANKTRALRFPDWAEANFGENYQEVLLRNQARALKQRSDEIDRMYPADDVEVGPSFVDEAQTVREIDEMNKANLDEILKGRKKNADGGRIGFDDGGQASREVYDKLYKEYVNLIDEGFKKEKLTRKDVPSWDSFVKNKGYNTNSVMYYADERGSPVGLLRNKKIQLINDIIERENNKLDGVFFKSGGGQRGGGVSSLFKGKVFAEGQRLGAGTKGGFLPIEGIASKLANEKLDKRSDKILKAFRVVMNPDYVLKNPITSGARKKGDPRGEIARLIAGDKDSFIKERDILKTLRTFPEYQALADDIGYMNRLLSKLPKGSDTSTGYLLELAKNKNREMASFDDWWRISGDAPEQFAMNEALRNWNAEKGEGKFKFYDLNGKPIKWKGKGQKLNTQNVLFSYTDLENPEGLGYKNKLYGFIKPNEEQFTKIKNNLPNIKSFGDLKRNIRKLPEWSEVVAVTDGRNKLFNTDMINPLSGKKEKYKDVFEDVYKNVKTTSYTTKGGYSKIKSMAGQIDHMRGTRVLPFNKLRIVTGPQNLFFSTLDQASAKATNPNLKTYLNALGAEVYPFNPSIDDQIATIINETSEIGKVVKANKGKSITLPTVTQVASSRFLKNKIPNLPEDVINYLTPKAKIAEQVYQETPALKNINVRNLQKLAVIGCGPKAARIGGRIGLFEGQNLQACAAKGLQKLQTTDPKNLTPGDKANVRAITKTIQGGRLLKNVLGPGALALEGLFALPFAAYDFARGRPGIDTLKNVASLGFLDQKLTDAELKKIFPEYGQAENLQNIGERLTDLERLQKGTRGQRIRSKPQFEKTMDQFETVSNPFLEAEDPEKAYFENIQKSQDAVEELQRQYDERALERKSQFDLSNPFMAAGGGIAKIAGVDQGPPPESGPNSQGLQGLMKRVKNL